MYYPKDLIALIEKVRKGNLESILIIPHTFGLRVAVQRILNKKEAEKDKTQSQEQESDASTRRTASLRDKVRQFLTQGLRLK